MPPLAEKDSAARSSQRLIGDFAKKKTTNPHSEVAGSVRSQVRTQYTSEESETRVDAVGARVDGAPPGPSRVASATNNGEVKPLIMRTTHERVRKRTLRRALKRAERGEVAYYQGRCLRPWRPDLPSAQTSPSITTPLGPERIKVIQWNCSGLSQELQLEWFTWIRQDPTIGIFTLIESHWSFTGDYKAQGWLLVHSGSGRKKSGGILVGIREDLVSKDTLKWQDLEQGRLLHVRCNVKKQQIDILAIYQHALSHTSQEEQQELMRKRHRLWNQMDHVLGGFPFRSFVILLGDFNMSFAPLAEVAGFGILAGSKVSWLVQERNEVLEMLRARRLVILNSWKKPEATYEHPNGRSQIDYIIVRKQIADNNARNSGAVAAPIAGWRSSGHRPVVASIKLNWKPWQHAVRQQSLVPTCRRSKSYQTLR